jgi:hypothetical protein
MKGCRLRVAHNDCKIKASGGLSGLLPAASFCKVKRGGTRIVILHKIMPPFCQGMIPL